MSSTHVTPGTIIEDRYKILDVLGVGGFATVYRALHMRLNSEVAIKVLDLDSREDTSEYQARFLVEAQAAASIKHPNIVSIFDFGVSDNIGSVYMAMELLEGHDLKEEVHGRGPVEPERAIRLFKGALDALGDAHTKGIVHKDLKPSNLFLCDPGTFKERLVVTDFGIARVLNTKQNTTSGKYVGTPQYFAPEYLKDQTALPALDVYQMGLILVEMLTGKVVVDHSDPMVCIFKHGSGELDVPKALLDSPMGPTISLALSNDHRQRYKNGHVFKRALEELDLNSLQGFEFSSSNVATPPSGLLINTGSHSAPVSGVFEPTPANVRVRESSSSERSAARPISANAGVAPEVSSASPTPIEHSPAPAIADDPPHRTSRTTTAVVIAGFALLSSAAISLMFYSGQPEAPPSKRGVDEALAVHPQPVASGGDGDLSAPGEARNTQGDAETPDSGLNAAAPDKDPPCASRLEFEEDTKTVEITFRSSPSNSLIEHKGKNIGITPCIWLTAATERAIPVRVIPPSTHREKKILVEASSDKLIEVELSSAGVPPRKIKRKNVPAPKKKSRVGTMR